MFRPKNEKYVLIIVRVVCISVWRVNGFILLPDSRVIHLPQRARKVLTLKRNPNIKKRRRKRNPQKRKGKLDQAKAPRPKRRLRSRYVCYKYAEQIKMKCCHEHESDKGKIWGSNPRRPRYRLGAQITELQRD